MSVTLAGLAVSPRTASATTGPDDHLGPYLERCTFPPADGGPVDLAVSGGPDSAALVVLAHQAGLHGTVIHVDHCLRPGSELEADSVRRLAARFGFAFAGRRVEVPAGSDLEARARLARYAALPPDVMTGHTMDDQAETVLLNVLRGTGIDGLAAMSPGASVRARPAVRRPLLGLRRAETADICRRAGVVPLQDPSNADPRFRRNRVRAEALPLLCDIAGRDLVPVLARQAGLMAADADLLAEMAAGLDPSDVRSLRAAPPALARRALRGWLRAPEAGAGPEAHPPTAAELNRVMEVVDGLRRACEISGGRRVSRHAGVLRLTRPEARP